MSTPSSAFPQPPHIPTPPGLTRRSHRQNARRMPILVFPSKGTGPISCLHLCAWLLCVRLLIEFLVFRPYVFSTRWCVKRRFRIWCNTCYCFPTVCIQYSLTDSFSRSGCPAARVFRRRHCGIHWEPSETIAQWCAQLIIPNVVCGFLYTYAFVEWVLSCCERDEVSWELLKFTSVFETGLFSVQPPVGSNHLCGDLILWQMSNVSRRGFQKWYTGHFNWSWFS